MGAASQTDIARAEKARAAPRELLDDAAEWAFFGRLQENSTSKRDGAFADPLTVRWESRNVVRGMRCAAWALTLEDAPLLAI